MIDMQSHRLYYYKKAPKIDKQNEYDKKYTLPNIVANDNNHQHNYDRPCICDILQRGNDVCG